MTNSLLSSLRPYRFVIFLIPSSKNDSSRTVRYICNGDYQQLTENNNHAKVTMITNANATFTVLRCGLRRAYC